MKKNIGQLCTDNHAEYLFKKCHEERVEANNTTNCEEKSMWGKLDRKYAHEMACRAFKDALGKVAQVVTCDIIEDDIKNIKENAKPVKEIADKCWAHIDVTKPTAPKFADVDKCLDHLIEIYNKYSLLTAGNVFPELDKPIFAGWDAPFRMTWA